MMNNTGLENLCMKKYSNQSSVPSEEIWKPGKSSGTIPLHKIPSFISQNVKVAFIP